MNHSDDTRTQLAIAAIMAKVADQFGVKVDLLRDGDKSRLVVLSRQVAMYCAKATTTASLEEIGQEFGGKHHTTVLHSIAKIHDQRRADPDLDRVIKRLLQKVGVPKA